MLIGRPACVLKQSNRHANERPRSKEDRDLMVAIAQWQNYDFATNDQMDCTRPHMARLCGPDLLKVGFKKPSQAKPS